MKRLLFGLFAAGVALSTSAFTTFTPKKKFTIVYYVLTNEALYQRVNDTPDPSNCEGAAAHKCFIGYSSYRGESFSSDAIPATPTFQSNYFGLYVQ